MRSLLLRSLPTQHKAIPTRSSPSQKLQRIFQPCSDVPLSTPHWGQPARSTQPWESGELGARRQRPKGRSSLSVRQCRHVHGTSLPRSMQASGRNGLVPLSCSSCGLEAFGVGSKFASLAEKSQLALRWEAHNSSGVAISGGFILPLKSGSRVLAKSSTKSRQTSKQRSARSI